MIFLYATNTTKLSRQRQHRRMIGKEYGIRCEQHDFGTVTVQFASYGHRGTACRRAVGVAAVAGWCEFNQSQCRIQCLH